MSSQFTSSISILRRCTGCEPHSSQPMIVSIICFILLFGWALLARASKCDPSCYLWWNIICSISGEGQDRHRLAWTLSRYPWDCQQCVCGSIFTPCFLGAGSALCYLELILIFALFSQKTKGSKDDFVQRCIFKKHEHVMVFDDFNSPTLILFKTMRKIFLFVFIILFAQGFKMNQMAISSNQIANLQS